MLIESADDKSKSLALPLNTLVFILVAVCLP